MKTSESSGIVELQEDVAGSPFYNHDLAPVGKSGRRWSTKDMAFSGSRWQPVFRPIRLLRA